MLQTINLTGKLANAALPFYFLCSNGTYQICRLPPPLPFAFEICSAGNTGNFINAAFAGWYACWHISPEIASKFFGPEWPGTGWLFCKPKVKLGKAKFVSWRLEFRNLLKKI
ncbi:hypothetical protein NPIL_384951 [Nephila pilipes]|uniref:Uncharacterized protein n=1 Tax=Nephila pilipes TaxID=299642 RepID=A0A8X6QH16_NEPPI|nr:hypothetical protein NPIL_384951 [Nephila pilipes]